MPTGSPTWLMHMRWLDLAFLHWPIDAAVLRPFLPSPLDVDTFDGSGWIGVVPFRMENVRPRFVPPVPGTHAFAEINVRTYARAGDRAGVWFFSLDAANRLAVRAARLLFNLPYFDARIEVEQQGTRVRYANTRVHAGAPGAEFRAAYAPTGGVFHAAPGTLEHFLTERYCLFTQSRRGEVGFLDVTHDAWPLQPGEAAIEVNRMVSAAGIALPDRPPIVHVAESLDVMASGLRPL